jgi:hypothetical protein
VLAELARVIEERSNLTRSATLPLKGGGSTEVAL